MRLAIDGARGESSWFFVEVSGHLDPSVGLANKVPQNNWVLMLSVIMRCMGGQGEGGSKVDDYRGVFSIVTRSSEDKLEISGWDNGCYCAGGQG